jgi:hypothetical protein
MIRNEMNANDSNEIWHLMNDGMGRVNLLEVHGARKGKFSWQNQRAYESMLVLFGQYRKLTAVEK